LKILVRVYILLFYCTPYTCRIEDSGIDCITLVAYYLCEDRGRIRIMHYSVCWCSHLVCEWYPVLAVSPVPFIRSIPYRLYRTLIWRSSPLALPLQQTHPFSFTSFVLQTLLFHFFFLFFVPFLRHSSILECPSTNTPNLTFLLRSDLRRERLSDNLQPLCTYSSPQSAAHELPAPPNSCIPTSDRFPSGHVALNSDHLCSTKDPTHTTGGCEGSFEVIKDLRSEGTGTGLREPHCRLRLSELVVFGLGGRGHTGHTLYRSNLNWHLHFAYSVIF
jgi:hypothetical protein